MFAANGPERLDMIPMHNIMNSTNLTQFKQSLNLLCLPESDPDLLLLISRDDLLDPDEKFLRVTGLAVLP